LLAKQFELAKIDEAKESTVVQVLDKAIEPDRKSKPKRSMIVLLAVVIALFLGVLGAFAHEALMKARGDPRHIRILSELKRTAKSISRSST